MRILGAAQNAWRHLRWLPKCSLQYCMLSLWVMSMLLFSTRLRTRCRQALALLHLSCQRVR